MNDDEQFTEWLADQVQAFANGIAKAHPERKIMLIAPIVFQSKDSPTGQNLALAHGNFCCVAHAAAALTGGLAVVGALFAADGAPRNPKELH